MVRQRNSDDAIIRQATGRGAGLKADLIDRAGGLLSAQQAADVLGIGTQAFHEREKRQALIAVWHEGALGYPAFQFESGAMCSGVMEILKVIGTDDPWSHLSFMFLKLDELGGEMPIDAIRSGNGASAALAARHFGRHGAA